MRYHVISLVAVFLALGIGILLGTTLVERGLIAEQKSQINSLRKTFSEIKDKNRTLNDELNAYERFSDEAKPYLITNRLAGRSIASVSTGDVENGVASKVNEAVNQAGGSVSLTLTFADPSVFAKPDVQANLSNLFQAPAQAQALKERTYAEVVNQLKTASNPQILTELSRLGVLQMSGSLTAPIYQAILVASKKSADPKFLAADDVPLSRAFVAAAYPVAGVAGSQTPDEVLLAYKKVGITTVDHVDTSPGQIAMVMALEGKGGNYGSGKAATRMIPEGSGI